MVKRPDGVGREKVRAELGLAVWEVELAAETGLLRRLPDRSFDPASVKAAQDDLEAFGRRLARKDAATPRSPPHVWASAWSGSSESRPQRG